MNTNDHPDLTAYALGELDAEHSEAMAQWVAAHPEARAEVDATTALSGHLQQSAPRIDYRLHAAQRAALLSGPQKVRQLVAAASQSSKRKPASLRFVLKLAGQFAAAALFLAAGFIAGTWFNARSPRDVASARPTTPPSAKPQATGTITVPFKAKEIPAPVIADAPSPEPVKPAPAPVATPAPKPEAPKTIVATAPVDPAAKEPARVPMPKTRVLTEAFVSTSKTALSQVPLHPAETRFVTKSVPTAAAIAPANTKPVEPVARTKQPELRIHSWKAEVASCPWNEAHRLVRITIQMPGDQEAAAAGLSYPLQVTFDPNYVRNYRRLSTRSLAAAAADAPAFHTVWYEFQPNGQPAASPRDGVSRMIGSITLPNARFTTTAMGPFDSSHLQIMDRGTSWRTAREDFLFETALAGFGLMLKGDSSTAGLNHTLLLNLAHRAENDDRTGECARFIKLVQDAQRMAGL